MGCITRKKVKSEICNICLENYFGKPRRHEQSWKSKERKEDLQEISLSLLRVILADLDGVMAQSQASFRFSPITQ